MLHAQRGTSKGQQRVLALDEQKEDCTMQQTATKLSKDDAQSSQGATPRISLIAMKPYETMKPMKEQTTSFHADTFKMRSPKGHQRRQRCGKVLKRGKSSRQAAAMHAILGVKGVPTQRGTQGASEALSRDKQPFSAGSSKRPQGGQSAACANRPTKKRVASSASGAGATH